jgi:GT2 family glycosyltransferase
VAKRPLRVDVCVITYRRPESLMRLLGALEQLRFPEERPELRIVVVDNDVDESARAVCEGAREWLGHPLVYAVEKRRGIPQARNRAISIALDHADFVAWIDDDEVPDREWLAELIRVQRRRNADAVAGPVRPVFPAGTPDWIARSRLFELPRHTTGARIDYAYTHNALVRCASLARMDQLFDERMALIGGEDSEFFGRFARAGRRIVWADLALVHEWVQSERTNRRWIYQRAWRVGCSSGWILRRQDPRSRSDAWIAANACWCIVKGGLLALPALLRGRAVLVNALRLVFYGAGRLASLVDVTYREYDREDRA